jgi:molecular chaperone HtpG
MTEERIPFRTEVARLLDIVVHSLYSEKEIFLRELISNASDACDKLRYMALTQPELTGDDTDFKITITTDQKARTLTVADNGIGMSRDELIECLGTIARSGTAAFLDKFKDGQKPDLTQIGQFGVGFYAAFMVAQMVEVVSKRAGSEEAWCWRSDGKGDFAVEPETKAARGTEVRLYLKQGEDEFLSEDRLRAIVTRYSDHIALPIAINGAADPANRASALWLRSKADITPDQYKEFYHHVAHAFEDPTLTLHWKAEGKIEYTGLLFIPGVKPYDLFDPRRKHGVKLYVKRVFITNDAEGLVPPYLRFLRGVIDSEDLPLNVSREMLQNSPMLAKIRQGVVRRVLGDLAHLAADDKAAYETFWADFGPVMKEGLYEDQDHRADLLKLLRCRSTTEAGWTDLPGYVARLKKGQDVIYYINGDNAEALAHSPHLEGFRARGIEVLLLTDAVDDFWPSAVATFDAKPFKSVTRATGEELDKIAALPEANDTPTPPPAGDVASLIALMKTTLGDKVKDVRASTRLTESPVCLATTEGDIDIHLERFLKQHNQLQGDSKRILEINPRHPLIAKMADKVRAEGAKAGLEDIAQLLLDQARLLDGETIADPAGFSQRLSRLLASAL